MEHLFATYVGKVHTMERLFATYVRKIYIMERTMERTKREQACQTSQRALKVWNPVQVSGRGTSKEVSNPGRVGLHK